MSICCAMFQPNAICLAIERHPLQEGLQQFIGRLHLPRVLGLGLVLAVGVADGASLAERLFEDFRQDHAADAHAPVETTYIPLTTLVTHATISTRLASSGE